MRPKTAKALLHLMGWTGIDGPAPEKKCIFLGVPHTSIADFFVAWLYYRSVGGHISIIVKDSFYRWPLRRILDRLGVIHIDRGHPTGTLKGVIDAFAAREELHLGLAPEGTRKAVKRWKTGFHTIAREAGVPVYTGFIDWGKKEVGIGQRFECTEDAAADLKAIQEWYKKKGVVGRHPEQFVFPDEAGEADL
ncbi:MAG: 1-acyl-sn-glycerol-3-phosphate acyltransferase [Bacteroidales bacterium]|nr:1-acyl-sn-glycerol-3-phosphate acyltransferase [Bacteroidales bacterium]